MDDRQLIADLLSALEYHTEQTRPIEFSKVAIQAAREYLRKPVQQLNAGVPPLYPEPERGVSIKAEYEPAQPMHPEIKKMYEDYFDKCFREPSPTQQEPVAWGVFEGNLHDMFFTEAEAVEMAQLKGTHAEVKPLYTTPPQRPWVGLTDEEIWETISRIGTSDSDVNPYAKLADARAIEAKLEEKNSG